MAGVFDALLDLVVALVPLHLSLGLGPDLEIRKYSFYIRRHDLEQKSRGLELHQKLCFECYVMYYTHMHSP